MSFPFPSWRGWLIALVVLGIAERIAVSYGSNYVLGHPDEHQQYIEQAYRHNHDGYGAVFWEQERGMRHLFFSRTLAVLLQGIEFAGIEKPLPQLWMLRCIVSLASFAVMVLFAWNWIQTGNLPAGFFLLYLLDATLSVVFVQTRIMGENVMAIPLVLSLLAEKRYPRLAGFLWAVMFAIRFQSAFLTMVFGLWAFGLDWARWKKESISWWAAFRQTRRLTEGLLVGMFLVGAFDAWTNQGWFHSPLAYVTANIVEDKAAQFGVKPWYYYLVYGSRNLFFLCPVFPLLLIPSLSKEPRLWVACAVYVLGHTMVGHKEMRFLWAIMPLGLILLSRGFEESLRQMQSEKSKWVWPGLPWNLAILASTFLLASVVNLFTFNWFTPAYGSSCLALEWVGKQADLKGVQVLGVFDFEAGNAFYFRRPPMMPHYQGEVLSREGLEEKDLREKGINYLIISTDREDVKISFPYAMDKVQQFGTLEVFRLRDDPGKERP